MPSDFLEKTLEDIVFENRSTIHERGLARFRGTAFRQVILPSGRKIDILGFDVEDGHLKYELYELKKDVINIDSVCQAYNYVEEINQLIKGSFKSCKPSITMIGKRYESLSILNAVSIPVNVYTYDYKMDGIRFEKRSHSKAYYPAHDHFSLGLLAFGTGMLVHTNGDPSSISFHSSMQIHLNKDNFETILREKKFNYLNEEIIEPQVPVQHIHKEPKTEIFPVQPNWSPEFLKGIVYDELIDEFEFEVDDCDDEIEELESDCCDDEMNGDYEPESDMELDNKLLFEPINFERWTLKELEITELYYSPTIKTS